ncbi:hypothetical protein B0H11DRAFT_2160098 [Mycena galericulata]|nr:hypothetical protein B0H11DRAFT_2160098 [Mycena galericulata]
MSISFGGLGIMSLRKPLREWAGVTTTPALPHRPRLSVLTFFFFFLPPAYLTNPSENSFRAYLTEQSFRHHLSRLDDNSDDQDTRDKHSSSQRRGSPPSSSTVPFDHGSPFHFANRASVSLRTPKHVFRSFGIFTVAAIIPARADRAACRSRRDRDSTIVTDSWFIGAFGKWYRGGVLDAWYQDVVARSTDEESWTSGILGMKALDKLNEQLKSIRPGLPFSTKNLPLRNRDNSTPPPLPKSASLPLHTPRPSTADRPHTSPSPNHSSQPNLATEQNRLASPALSRSPSTLFDQSPRIAEVLHQISLSKNSLHDLRTQLADFQVGAAASHASLQGEVDSFRDNKRQEDASRSELKSRTKTLDDSKRAAESIKRDAEKKLKAAQNARDDAKISTLQQRLADDQSSVLQSQEISQPEQDITEALEHKRQEIKVAEDVIAALNLRARELEDKLSSERERLKLVRERAELRKQDRSFHPQHAAAGPWPVAPRNFYDSNASGEPVDIRVGRGRRSSDPHALPTSPRPTKLALGGISNFNNGPALGNLVNPGPRSNGYSIFDDVFLNQPSRQVSGNFSPFGDPEQRAQVPLMSPTSQSLIPAGIITSLDSGDGSSRSFQSDSDAFMDKEWREASLHRTRSQHLHASDSQTSPSFGPITMSPTSLHEPSANDYERDSFEVRVLTSPHGREYRMPSESPMDMQRVSLAHRHSDPTSGKEDESTPPIVAAADKAVSRRWFASTKEKPKKGLNPDAKVFSLPRKGATTGPSPRVTAYDALNPNGMGSNMMAAPASASHSLLRAFAPSPAEREALHRALGGSTNTSLERLPSLSEMGSVPTSPSHVHAVPAGAGQHGLDVKGLPSWLSALPRIRKPNFSPWDDEEPTLSSGEDKKEERR